MYRVMTEEEYNMNFRDRDDFFVDSLVKTYGGKECFCFHTRYYVDDEIEVPNNIVMRCPKFKVGDKVARGSYCGKVVSISELSDRFAYFVEHVGIYVEERELNPITPIVYAKLKWEREHGVTLCDMRGDNNETIPWQDTVEWGVVDGDISIIGDKANRKLI